MKMPPGHMIQQIVDESGTLKHIILSATNCTSGGACGVNSVTTCTNSLPAKSHPSSTSCSNITSSASSPANSSQNTTQSSGTLTHSGVKSCKNGASSGHLSSNAGPRACSFGNSNSTATPFLVNQLFVGQSNASTALSMPTNVSGNNGLLPNSMAMAAAAATVSGHALLPYPYCCCCCYECAGLSAIRADSSVISPNSSIHHHSSSNSSNATSGKAHPTSGSTSSLPQPPKHCKSDYSHTYACNGSAGGASNVHQNHPGRSPFNSPGQPLNGGYAGHTSGQRKAHGSPAAASFACSTGVCGTSPSPSHNHGPNPYGGCSSNKLSTSAYVAKSNGSNGNKLTGEPIDANRARANLALALAQNLPYHTQLTMPPVTTHHSQPTSSSAAAAAVMLANELNGPYSYSASRAFTSHFTSGSWRKGRSEPNHGACRSTLSRYSTATNSNSVPFANSCSNGNINNRSSPFKSTADYATEYACLPIISRTNTENESNKSGLSAVVPLHDSGAGSSSPSSEHYEFGSNDSELNSGGSASPVHSLSPKRSVCERIHSAGNRLTASTDSVRVTRSTNSSPAKNTSSIGTYRKLLVRKKSGDALLDLITPVHSDNGDDSRMIDSKHRYLPNVSINAPPEETLIERDVLQSRDATESDLEHLKRTIESTDSIDSLPFRTSILDEQSVQSNSAPLKLINRNSMDKIDSSSALLANAIKTDDTDQESYDCIDSSEGVVDGSDAIEIEKRLCCHKIEPDQAESLIGSIDRNTIECDRIDSPKKTNESKPIRLKQNELPQVLAFRLIYTSLSSSSVKLKWSSCLATLADQHELTTTAYQVEMWQSRSDPTFLLGSCSPPTVKPHSRLVYNGPVKHCKVLQLLPEQEYAFRVRAVAQYASTEDPKPDIQCRLWLSNTLTITTPKSVGTIVNGFVAGQSSLANPWSPSHSALKKRNGRGQPLLSSSVNVPPLPVAAPTDCSLSSGSRCKLNGKSLLTINSDWLSVCTQFSRDQSCAFALLLLFCGIACSFAYMAQQLIDV
jgi:hypothetical protein